MAYPYRKSQNRWQKPVKAPVVKAPPTFTPSAYQAAILDWLRDGNGNTIVEATAGSGKTATLCLVAFALPKDSSAVFLAFGRDAAQNLTDKLPFPASTFHAMCRRFVLRHLTQNLGIRVKTGNEFVEIKKLDRLADEFGQSFMPIRSVVLRLVGLCKQETYREPTNDQILELYDRHDLDYESADHTLADVCDYTRRLLEMSRDRSNLQTIDFDDMLYLVTYFDLKLDQYDYVMVDEAQDTNPVQREVIRRLMRPTSRLIAVGDPAQAIYGFRGASNDALDLIRDQFHASTLPLTVSYRCSRAVVDYASHYGKIEAAPNAKEGTVTVAEKFRLSDFAPNDLVLCRNTAPLVQTCYRLIARRVCAQIKGRDIGAGLISLIKKVNGARGTLETLPERLEAYRERETARCLQNRQETKAQSITDRVESILSLVDSMTPEDIELGLEGLVRIIQGMFTDNAQENCVLLSTIHKAKGLEADRVVILDNHLMPSKMAKQPWQRQQERNIQFVAYTRAKMDMVFVQTETLVSE